MSTTNWIRASASPAAITTAAIATLGVDTNDLSTTGAPSDGHELGAEGGARVPLVPDPLGPANRADRAGGAPEPIPVLALRRCPARLQPLAPVDHLALLVLVLGALGVADTVLARANPLSRILVVLDQSVIAEAVGVRNGGRQHGAGLGRDSLRRDQHEAEHGHTDEQGDESLQLATAPDGGGFHIGAHEDPPSTSAYCKQT